MAPHEDRKRQRTRDHDRQRTKNKKKRQSQRQSLSADAAEELGRDGHARPRRDREQRDRDRDQRRQRPHRDEDGRARRPSRVPPDGGGGGGGGSADRHHPRGSRGRVVSGALLEEGGWPEEYHKPPSDQRRRGSKAKKKKKKLLYILIAAAIVVLIIIIVAAVVVSKKNKGDGGGGGGDIDSGPSKANLVGLDPNSVPAQWKGTYLDPWSWYDTSGFNVTFTDATVGDLPIMGLMSAWDDSAAPNGQVPALDAAWGSYAARPARGVNLGGWLSLEPFITPSLFAYDLSLGIIDEWTLCTHLGPSGAAAALEKHYATFVTEATFRDVAAAGLDHVRIPFSYWAVQTYDSDPYVFRTSWRYLLRGIEWARKYGLRVNLDLHGLPGSQNGWNHSGRFGAIGWLNGTDGQTNAQRSLDVHGRLSLFFAQERYRNVISHYGLANEPKMTALEPTAVTAWTQTAFDLVRANGIGAVIVFGDGFMGLEHWQGQLAGNQGLALDVHQYVIFNPDQIGMSRHDKVAYACTGWTQQAEQSMNLSTGFGPTLFAEWSQADTDCATYVTNVGWGNRWTGTYDDHGHEGGSVLTPRCPTRDGRCSCGGEANSADTGSYSDGYRQFLQMFAEAQMHSFERGWGWWYWTWQTESAPLWSYKAGLDAGILPAKAYDRSFDCSGTIPDWDDVPEWE